MTLNVSSDIKLLQIPLLFWSQFFPPHFQRFIDPLDTAEADDRARDSLVDPSQRDMAHLPAFLVRKLFDPLDDFSIRVCMSGREHRPELLSLRSGCGAVCAGRSCQMTSAEWCPGDQADASLSTELVHFSLFFSVK